MTEAHSTNNEEAVFMAERSGNTVAKSEAQITYNQE
jgi:hypothetical protein